MTESIIAGTACVLVAIIEFFAARDRKSAKEQREKVDRRAALRAEESMLSMKMQNATLQLSIVSANALTNGHNNGNVERARQTAEEAMREYESFLHGVAAKAVTKV